MADSCLLDGSTSPFFGSDLTRRFHYHTAIILAFRLFLRPPKTDLFNKYPFPVITKVVPEGSQPSGTALVITRQFNLHSKAKS